MGFRSSTQNDGVSFLSQKVPRDLLFSTKKSVVESDPFTKGSDFGYRYKFYNPHVKIRPLLASSGWGFGFGVGVAEFEFEEERVRLI